MATLALQLRALGDERRLRLLRLCAEGPASVSSLAAALPDSEPNVSRQLKQLAEAGLLRRSRLGQFVEYSLVDGSEPAARTAQWLLGQLSGDDAGLRAARGALRRTRGAERARASTVRGLAPASRLGTALAGALAAATGSDARGRRVLMRVRHPELVVAIAGEAAELSLVASSVAARAALRRWAAARGLDVEIDLAGAFGARASGLGWDLVVLDAGTGAETGVMASLESDFAFARRSLRAQGRAWLIADYDALARIASDGVSPLQRLRSLARAAGFESRALLPVEAEGRHLLVARTQAAGGTASSLAQSA